MNNVVIINHGEYYTLYAKLKNLKVQKGDLISEKQVIADLVTNNDGITQLQFQIWKNILSWIQKIGLSKNDFAIFTNKSNNYGFNFDTQIGGLKQSNSNSEKLGRILSR